MKFRPFIILIGVVFFFISEEFILKWLPVNDLIYSLSRFAGELFLYFLTFLVLGRYFLQNRSLQRTPLDKYFIAIALIFILSALINGSSLIPLFSKLRIFFRYVSAYYLIVHLVITPKEVRSLVKMLTITGVFQVVVSLYQQLVEVHLSTFWMPREVTLVVGNISKGFRTLEGLDAGFIVGTMALPGQLAIFFVIISVSLIALNFYKYKIEIFKKNRLMILGALFTLLVGVTISYTRSAAIIVMLAFPIVANFSGARANLAKLGLVLMMALIPLIFFTSSLNAVIDYYAKFDANSLFKEDIKSPIEELQEAFTVEYYEEEASKNRLWVIGQVVPVIIKNFKLLGYGAEEATVRMRLWQDGTPIKILSYKPFKDVYWVNLMAHFGIFGFFSYVFLLRKIGQMAKVVYYEEENSTFRFSGLWTRGLVYAFALGAVVAAVFEYRPNILIFWVVTGIMVNRYLNIRDQK